MNFTEEINIKLPSVDELKKLQEDYDEKKRNEKEKRKKEEIIKCLDNMNKIIRDNFNELLGKKSIIYEWNVTNMDNIDALESLFDYLNKNSDYSIVWWKQTWYCDIRTIGKYEKNAYYCLTIELKTNDKTN